MTTNFCSQCAEKEKKLKIMIADYEFQIKKIQQDKSTEKAMYEIYLHKQVKRWQQLYHKQKSTREDEVKNWMDKYDMTIKKYEDEKKLLIETHLFQSKNQIQNLNHESENKIRDLVLKQEDRITTTTQRYQEQIRCMKIENELKMNQLITEHENYISSLKRSSKQVLDQKIKVYESRILGAESEKVKQEKLHEQTKNQNKDIQSKLYQQLFGVRKNVAELEIKLQEQIKYSKLKQQNIDELKQQIQKIIEEHQQQIKILTENHQKNVEELQQNFKIKLTELLQENLDSCKKYQNAIEKIEQKRENQKALYLNNIEEINVFVGNRASRPEDIQEIYSLKQTLSKKSRQCECLAEQLKIYRLELENKEQTYNKIFVPITNQCNQNIMSKRKQFKLRRQGKSVTTVREALQSISSANMGQKKFPPKPKVL